MTEPQDHRSNSDAGPEDVEWTVAATVLIALALLLAWVAASRPVYVAYLPGVEPQRPRPDMRLDLNSADAASLEALPRLGPALASRIAADREAHGPYQSLDDLQRVPGIGERTIDLIAPHVVVRPLPDPDRP